MIFIDFGLLRSPYCKISYLFSFLKGLFVLLVDIRIRVKIVQPTYDSVCENNIAFMANVGNVLLPNVFFLNFFARFYVF